ncbi:hypothetical protein [Amycolatopsis sp. NPDC051716]|uniref:hypothetical protein n=1 Tax=Amycolatopsis sp. NPDC051716 TaxID=3155804 RepID=UPI0034428DCE
MAEQQWRIRVRGKQRDPIVVELLIAAVMELAEQLRAEQALAALHEEAASGSDREGKQ